MRRLGLRSHRVMAVCTCWSLSGRSMRFLYRPRAMTVLTRELIAFRAASSAVPSLRHIPLRSNFIYIFPFFLLLNPGFGPFIYQTAHNFSLNTRKSMLSPSSLSSCRIIPGQLAEASILLYKDNQASGNTMFRYQNIASRIPGLDLHTGKILNKGERIGS